MFAANCTQPCPRCAPSSVVKEPVVRIAALIAKASVALYTSLTLGVLGIEVFLRLTTVVVLPTFPVMQMISSSVLLICTVHE